MESPTAHAAGSPGSLLPQQQINDPSAPHMRPTGAAVEEHFRVCASGFLQRIGEDRHPIEGAVGVNGRRYSE